MNMILHGQAGADNPAGEPRSPIRKFMDGDTLIPSIRCGHPPFSDKRWSNGVDPLNDPWERSRPFGTPPGKQGDYAYLLHIIRSLSEHWQRGCILPHALSAGNAEGDIRRNLVRSGIQSRGSSVCRANLSTGTRHPGLHRGGRQGRTRKPVAGIFMIDASAGVKGRSEEPAAQHGHPQDRRCLQPDLRSPGTPRMCPFELIEKNEFNLNLPRYIDSQTPEDVQDIEGHLRGGISGCC